MASMTVEQLIEEIEVYIDNRPVSGLLSGGNMIKVNREELLAMIDELKYQLPRELSESREIVRTQDNRIEKAKAEAERILDHAAKEAGQLIDNDELVTMANMRAEQIIEEANEEADAILADARAQAYSISSGALQYTQSILEGLENMYKSMIEQETGYFQAVVDKLKDDYKQIVEDKREIDIQLGNGLKGTRSKEDFEKKEAE